VKPLLLPLLLIISSTNIAFVNSAAANDMKRDSSANRQYVHSKVTQVYAKPAFNADRLGKLSYGDEVEILRVDKSWANIRYKDMTGWVAKMVLANAKPLPKTAVEQQAQPDSRNKARKRASVRASAAATRGLSDNFRQRKDDPMREANYPALHKVEEIKVEEKDVLEFNQSLSQ